MLRGRQLADFQIASQPGNERIVMERVADAVRGLGLADVRLARLKTAVAEAALNAMEHGNRFCAQLPVTVRIAASDDELCVTVIDEGGEQARPERVEPSLEAKLAGQQSPRGWGLFLIEHMVDDVSDECVGTLHSVHLRLRLRPTDQPSG